MLWLRPMGISSSSIVYIPVISTPCKNYIRVIFCVEWWWWFTRFVSPPCVCEQGLLWQFSFLYWVLKRSRGLHLGGGGIERLSAGPQPDAPPCCIQYKICAANTKVQTWMKIQTQTQMLHVHYIGCMNQCAKSTTYSVRWFHHFLDISASLRRS